MKKISISPERRALWAKTEEGSIVSAGAMNLQNVIAERRNQNTPVRQAGCTVTSYTSSAQTKHVPTR